MLIPFFSLYCVDAATVHGTIYDSDIEVVNGVIVTINTLPEQTSVASQGDYSFEVNVGDYFIEFEYFEENQLVYSQIEEISIIEEGNYLIDIILLPNLNDDITEDNLDVINPYNGSSTYWIVYIILLLIVSYFVWRKIKNPPLKKTSLEEDDIKKVLEVIQKEGGRTTQKDIRKKLFLSEAKASLILTELEHDKKIRRIKKGRGNIIILNK